MQSKLKLLSIPYLIWMFIFILLPMLLVFIYSMTVRNTNFTLNIESLKFTLENFIKFFKEGYYLSLYNSLFYAFIATVFSFIFGYPVAFILSQMKSKWRNLLLLVIILPMWMNMLLRTYAWKYIIGRTGLINQGVKAINDLLSLNIPILDIMNTKYSVIIGMTYNYIPFMILPIFAVLVKLDKDLLLASYDLGANKFWTFLKVIFPLSIPGVVSGVTLVFLPAATSFVIPYYLGGGQYPLIGSQIEKYFKGDGYNPNFGSALSIILIAIIFGLMALISMKFKDEERGKSLW